MGTKTGGKEEAEKKRESERNEKDVRGYCNCDVKVSVEEN
jgi:hypothetical protein